jgi:hypothetical protein
MVLQIDTLKWRQILAFLQVEKIYSCVVLHYEYKRENIILRLYLYSLICHLWVSVSLPLKLKDGYNLLPNVFNIGHILRENQTLTSYTIILKQRGGGNILKYCDLHAVGLRSRRTW